jgi:hypothetical protein
MRGLITATIWIAGGAITGLLVAQVAADFFIEPQEGMSVVDYSGGIAGSIMGLVIGAFIGALVFAILRASDRKAK